jgi:hypothetical protein
MSCCCLSTVVPQCISFPIWFSNEVSNLAFQMSFPICLALQPSPATVVAHLALTFGGEGERHRGHDKGGSGRGMTCKRAAITILGTLTLGGSVRLTPTGLGDRVADPFASIPSQKPSRNSANKKRLSHFDGTHIFRFARRGVLISTVCTFYIRPPKV